MYNYYDKLVVKIEYHDISGSGIIISDAQEKKNYLISAHHCFEKEEKIDYKEIKIYRQENGCLNLLKLKFERHISLIDVDIIIFEINNLLDVYKCQIINCNNNDQVFLVGFPRSLEGDDSTTKRYKLSAKVNEIVNKKIFNIDSERSLETYNSDSKTNTAGFSGCGVFLEHKSNCYLCGIITSLSSNEGAFYFFNATSINYIDEYLFNNMKIHLNNAKFKNFEFYRDSTLEIFEPELKRICSVHLKQVAEKITPQDIIETRGNKIVWPYSNITIINSKVWEEWLLYLIIRSIENKSNLENKNFYVINNNGNKRDVQVLYTSEYVTLPDFLNDYLKNACQDIKKSQIMVIQTDKVPSNKKMGHKNIKKIVKNICESIEEDTGILIDETEEKIGEISIVHIEEFTTEMAKFMEENDELSRGEIEKKLSERIKGIFDEI